MAQALVDQGQILPILDGLDEVPAPRRSEVVRQLNASLTSSDDVVITSRSEVYEDEIRRRWPVSGAAVIRPTPITSAEAVRYLKDNLPRELHSAWTGVFDRIGTAAAQEFVILAAKPLWLWLILTVYGNARADPISLVDKDHPDRVRSGSLAAHLLDQLTPALVRARPPSSRRAVVAGGIPLRPRKCYDPERVQYWLAVLAKDLRKGGDDKRVEYSWWQLAPRTFRTPLQVLAAKLGVGVAVGLALGLVGLIVGEVSGGPERVWLMGCLTGGVAAALALRISAEPGQADFRLRDISSMLHKLRSLSKSMGWKA